MTNNNTGQRRQISSREKRLQERKKARNASTARNDNNMEAADEEVLFTPVGTIPPEGEEVSDDDMGISDDETVRGGSNRQPPPIVNTRCTLKLKVTGGKNAFGRALSLVKEFFTQLKKFDKWASIVPWYENVVMGVDTIEDPKDIMMDPTAITSYLPRFMNRKIKNSSKYDEYVSIYIGHSVDLEELLLDLGTWLQNGEHALYVDMLQAERKREVGFLTNSYFTMDLNVLKTVLEQAIGCNVGLRWKPIAGTHSKDNDPVRATHIEVDANYYHKALRILSNTFGKGVSGFKDGRKMRFFASLKNAKSAETRASIRKAIERQRFFVAEVKRDYFSDILHLDVTPNGSNLPTMREMIGKIRSIKFPHLKMIHSVDETWKKVSYKGDFTYLVMPHIEEEAELMMSNLLPFMRYEYGDEVLEYFTSTAKELSMDDRWDPVTKRVICTVDTNAELDDEEDELGFDEAIQFIKERNEATAKLAIDSTNKVTRPELNTNKTNLQVQQEAAAQVDAMTNAAEAAYYKDDDSISTMASFRTEKSSTRTNSTTHNNSHTHTNTSSVPTTEDNIHQSRLENMSVTSSITMESFNNLQTQVTNQDYKLSHIEQLIGRVAAAVLKGDQASQPKSTHEDDNTGGTSSASGEGL